MARFSFSSMLLLLLVSHPVFNFFNTNSSLQETHILTVDCAIAPPAMMGAQYLAQPIARHKTQTTHDYTLSIVRVYQGVGQPPMDPSQTKSASSAYAVSDLVKRCLISVLILILILIGLVQLICAIKGRNTTPPLATPIFQVMNMHQPDFELPSNVLVLQRAPLAAQHSHGNAFNLDAEVDVQVD
ncbi:uncharacterized protein LOC133714286 [Rosa rugosa]|uniref:uncharacterized protein LOC133714286 n=1 Tax=Rosa rugosa TaxID=74645 RepID=UPI002B407419|nr:uncharacterized protein LOC133714286 [Rosa rugosa]XP_061996359.1 uncharacterized protein LOC133714286 [Rosa rugosa]